MSISIYEGLTDMISLLFTLLAPSVAARDTFYPPLNHTTFITNTSLGTYGGIYSAPADQASPTTSDDGYNYCSMPHPRVDTYVLPPPIANGSVSGQLVYLEYLQRHQRRTPYNILPGGENQEYNCNNVQPFLYAAPASQDPSPLHVYAQSYSDPTNPFLAGYVNGSCQYPQLTVGGFLDGYEHGRDLRAVYRDQLQLIPSSPDEDNGNKVWLRSSSSALTQGSAGGVLRGLWPDYRGSLPLHQQASSVDTVDQGFSCSARSDLLSVIESTAEWEEHLSVTASLRTKLATMFDANSSSWTSTFDHFADNFQARLCNGYQLPCSIKDDSLCVTQQQADEVFRAGDWEWNYWWRYNANATRYIQLVEGLFIGEIVRHLEAVAENTSTLVYSHNFVHDGDLGPILGALGIKALRWPGMGSNIAFEIWKTSDSEHYARVLYSGRAIETIHGTLDWVPLSSLVNILKPFVPDDIVSLCESN
ncbi:histidine phosphatase family protein [Aspergillus homomorphus CBS 101889]|uniref:Histidine acid phosphatase n=1 Tax=Aspergillus homomorphus (strain CBS 101889) TaxID=1450537 RepID=A0A395HPW4_ASPHC|nr:histidine acid phosphatase [Aspergillus homomorphus CBS 101889]RAL08898.1 histidine acid phosphatase [Aspergillus homomorphus CBS 101889]